MEAHRLAERQNVCQWPRPVQDRALALARLLEPRRPVGFEKIRVGGWSDGGYVMVDDFAGVRTALSLGVGPNVDWDVSMAERGIEVHEYDHTVDAPPRTHPLIHFHKRQITAVKMEGTESLQSILETLGTREPASVILKIDIENDEWAVFRNAPREVLGMFSQVLCEFHAFNYMHQDFQWDNALAGLSKLREQFDVVHVHGNNCAEVYYIDGRPVPAVVEAALVNKTRVRTEPTDESFPSPLDRPNNVNRADFYLGNFHFPPPRPGAAA